jgi:hypothetical protein
MPLVLTPYSPLTEKAMRRLFDSLGERERRIYAGAEALKFGHGGQVYLAKVLDCDKKTIRRGILELQDEPSFPPGRSRKKGADGKPV